MSDKVVDDGITWVARQKLGDLKLVDGTLAGANETGYTGTDYYKVANVNSGGEIILALVKFVDMRESLFQYRFFKDTKSTYFILSYNSDVPDTTMNTYSHLTGTSYSNLVLKSLQPDAMINVGKTNLYDRNAETKWGTVTAVANLTGVTKAYESKWGWIYKLDKSIQAQVNLSNDSIHNYTYYMTLNDGTNKVYESRPTFLKDDGSFDVTWTNTIGAAATYSKVRTAGCSGFDGTFGAYTDKTVDADAVAKIGTKSALYFTTDLNSNLAKASYEIYKVGHEADAKTIADYITNLGAVVWVDDLGSAVLYQNNTYQPNAECGKPVVYLYPTKTTSVDVRVGADVTVSEPEYGRGWLGVIAKPNGQLTFKGKAYDSLFWEGLGHGQYPAIKTGTVVKAEQAVSTIKSQLSYIGLNVKEISDFLAFWEPKLPKTGNVRLTWFQNKEMDELAPLKVSPKPDTTIRVFLDFSKVNDGYTIAPQNLQKYSRTGFVAVEWGGLLKK